MRLHKILADAGVASRRGAERLMAEGRVAVNGRVVAEPGAQADPERDVITVDGRPLERPTKHIYVALNKPAGVVTTARDPQGRPTATALVDRPERLFTVGRLDRDTEGLLLLTNDGTWANRVAHPSGGVEKEYEAVVDGIPGTEDLERLAAGVEIDDGFVARGEARLLEELDGQARVSLILHQGHKRQARLMFGAIGYPVRHLVRVRVGGLRLGRLEPGQWRDLTLSEVALATRRAGLPARTKGTQGRNTGKEREREYRRGTGPGDAARRSGAVNRRENERHAGAPDGDRDRRTGGVGQVDNRPGPGAGARPALPGHRNDVPRRDMAGPAPRRRPRR